jgi:hypothetical protein
MHCLQSLQSNPNHQLLKMNITIPISEIDRQTAERFALPQTTKEKARQVYLNTLAVLVVHHYLQILEFPTELEPSRSWHPVDRTFLNIADLYLPELGFLECRPLRRGMKQFYIPPEVWADRIAFMAVEIDRTCQNGVILGFLPTVDRETIDLEELFTIDEAIAYLHAYKPTVKLLSWLQHNCEKGWESPEALLTIKSLAFRDRRAKSIENSSVEGLRRQLERLYGQLDKHPQLSPHPLQTEPLKSLVALVRNIDCDEDIRWQAAEILWSIDSEHPHAGVRRVKDLSNHLSGSSIALMVGV